MVVTIHGAHLAGASALVNSLQLGAASTGSLDPASCYAEECESSYTHAKAPLSFSKGGGGGGSSSMTMPGPLSHNIDRPRTDTPTLDADADRTTGRRLDEVKELIGLRDGDNAMTMYRKFSEFNADIMEKLELYEGQETMMEHLDQYHRAFDCFDTLLDDENADIAFHAAHFISKTLMTCELSEAIYPGLQMTYRGRFLKRARGAWNRGIIPVTEKITPMVRLIWSLGTNRSAIPEAGITKLNDIAVSRDKDEFSSLVDAISKEATSDNVDRSTSAAFAFVLSARLIEDPSRLEELTKAFLDHVGWSAVLYRDKANYWIPMGAINDTGNLIDNPSMYTAFINFVAPCIYGDFVPPLFHLAGYLHVRNEERLEELVTLVHNDLIKGYLLKMNAENKLKHKWKFTLAERAIVRKAADILKLENAPDVWPGGPEPFFDL
jgi:hypothetical protein